MAQIEITVTYLQMTTPPLRRLVDPPFPGVEIERALHPNVAFYRYLYNTVGEPWQWYERRLLSDDELAAIIHAPGVEIYVLYVDGVPAGYAEIDRRRPPDIELAYFGLIPEYIGRGLGKYLLRWIIIRAWNHNPSRLWLHTCTLDHPRALTVYEREGFVSYQTVVEHINDPREAGYMAK